MERSMKVTPVKVSTPLQPVLPSISENINEELSSEETSLDDSKSSNSMNSGNSVSHTFSGDRSAWYMNLEPSFDQEDSLKTTELCQFPVTTSDSTPVVAIANEITLCQGDYQTARLKRRAFVGFSDVHGVFGFYRFVSEVRSDIKWVKTKSHLRQRRIASVTWDEYETHRKQHAKVPVVSYTLILLCTILLGLSIYLNDGHFEKMSRNPSFGPSVETLVAMGALSASKIIEEDEWSRLFVATVLHGGVLHWLCNMIAVAFLGPELERNHGSGTIALVFVVAGSAANLVSAVLSPLFISVGASGGLCAWYGVCLVDGLRHWSLLQALQTFQLEVSPFPWRCAMFSILLELVALLLFGLLPWVDNFGHLGGLFFGICVGVVVLQTPEDGAVLGVPTTSSPVRRRLVQFNCKGAILCFAVAFCATNVLWLHQSNSVGDLPCRQCRYMDCPPLPIFQTHCDPCHAMTQAYYKLSSSNTEVDIELHCPYGDVVYFTTPAVPSNQDAWMSVCRARCDI